VILLAIVAGAPDALLHVVKGRTRACFARIEEAGFEDCGKHAGALAWLQKIPWTARAAQLLAEESDARMAAMAYLDAAVGEPNADALHARFNELAPIEARVLEGSGRIALDLLGPRITVPAPDTLAQQAGDRKGLLQGAEGWVHHYSRSHALDAALLEGDLEKTVALARRYFDTPSPAVRLRAAALACAGGAPADGMRVAAAVEEEYADGRKANYASNFGGARVVLEACAGLAKRPPPKIPSYGHAGGWDHRARLVARRLFAGCNAGDCARTIAAYDEQIRYLLSSGRAGPYRLELVALIAPALRDAEEVQVLARPLKGEPPLFERLPETIDDFVERAADAPFIPPAAWDGAADALEKLHADAKLVDSMRLQAVVGHALAGERALADRALARVTQEGMRARFGGAAALLGGDRNEARRRVELASVDDAALMLMRAELRMPDAAAARAVATRALELARQSGRHRLVERARWLLLALGEKVSDAPVPPRVPRLGGTDARSPAARARDLDDVLATWQSWLSSPPEARRRARWQAFRHGGDAPAAVAAYAFALGRLADRPEQIETWLDAALAQDVRRLSLRRYALARWQAAVWRGDDAAAERWRKRFLELAELAAAPRNADLMLAARL
jgi:hypothetical protein